MKLSIMCGSVCRYIDVCYPSLSLNATPEVYDCLGNE